MKTRATVAKIISVRPLTMDCTTIRMHTKIIDGPTYLLDKIVLIDITPSDGTQPQILLDLLEERRKALDSLRAKGA